MFSKETAHFHAYCNEKNDLFDKSSDAEEFFDAPLCQSRSSEELDEKNEQEVNANDQYEERAPSESPKANWDCLKILKTHWFYHISWMLDWFHCFEK